MPVSIQINLYVITSLVSAFVSGAVALYVWQNRATAGAKPLILFMIAALEWSLTYALEMAVPSLGTKIFWGKMQYFGIVGTTLTMLILVFEYTGNEKWFNRYTAVFLAIVPILSVLLAWTNEWHHLIWQITDLATDHGFTYLHVTHGGFFWVLIGYSYFLLVVGMGLLLRSLSTLPATYRQQTFILLAGISIPWLGNLVYVTGLNPLPHLDFTPLMFTFSGLLATWGLFRFRFLELAPIARSRMIEEMADVVIVIDAPGRVVDVNPEALKLTGLTTADVIGRPLKDVLPPGFKLPIDNFPLPEINTQIFFETQQKYYDLWVSSLKNRNNRVNGQLIVLHNSTQSKLTEIALRNYQVELEAKNLDLRKLTRAVEQSGSTVVITNLDGTIEYVNPAFTRITGYTSQEVMGKNPRILKSGRQGPELYRELWQTISHGEVWSGELINKKKNGDSYWEFANIAPVKSPSGAITHYIAIKEDITRRKEMELALAQARDEAVQASHLKTQLLANVSHDMRSPLGAILGYTEMLQGELYGPISHEQYEILTRIIEGTQQLLDFINNLLNQAQLESGKIILNNKLFKPQELFEVVQSAAKVFAEAKGVKLITEICPDMPPQLIGDPYWLRQILANLVNNAIKFTDSGFVQVSLSSPNPTCWIMQVKDTGCGIPEEAQDYVFEAFRQVDGTITKKYHGGSGLGLSIVTQLVTLMDGQIALTSRVNEGSTFVITFPLKPIQETQQ